MNEHNDYRGIWERRDDESDVSYERFRIYLTMPKRSINEVAKKANVTDSYLRKVAVNYSWTQRAAAYDRWVQAELSRKAQSAAVLEINTNTAENRFWIEQNDKMMQELWNFRSQLLAVAQKMLSDFEVGNKTNSGEKTYVTWEMLKTPDGEGGFKEERVKVRNVVRKQTTDPRWSWGDTVRVIEMVDKLGQQVLNLPTDAIKVLPEFLYQLRRNGHDPVDFMRRTIEKLKAS